MPLKVYKQLLNYFGPQGWWPAKTKLEIIVGAILTQNTNWKNVEKALKNLKNSGCLSLNRLKKIEIDELENLIRPCGFYKQKATRVLRFLKGINSLKSFFRMSDLRERLLSLNGIGPETADSIILYAAERPIFVIDAYTIRIGSRLGFFTKQIKYEQAQDFFQKTIPKDLEIYKEFHALIVALAKVFCKREPECEGCPLNAECRNADDRR